MENLQCLQFFKDSISINISQKNNFRINLRFINSDKIGGKDKNRYESIFFN